MDSASEYGKIKLRTNAENGNQIDRLKSIGFVWRKEEPIIPKGVNGAIPEEGEIQ